MNEDVQHSHKEISKAYDSVHTKNETYTHGHHLRVTTDIHSVCLTEVTPEFETNMYLSLSISSTDFMKKH